MRQPLVLVPSIYSNVARPGLRLLVQSFPDRNRFKIKEKYVDDPPTLSVGSFRAGHGQAVRLGGEEAAIEVIVLTRLSS